MPAPKINATPMQVAYFRFGLIAPVIQGTYPDASEAAYYRRVTREPVDLPGGGSFTYSPDTLEKWAGQYRRHGMDGLLTKTRKDKGESRTIGMDAAAEASRILSEFPGASGVAIHGLLVKGGFIPATVSVRAVQRFIKANGLRDTAPGEARVRRAFEMDRFGKLWQCDTAYLPYITPEGCGKPRRTYCVMIVDDHSRMIVGGRIFFADNALNFENVLKSAVASYGIPDKLYMDNGSPYRNEQVSFILGNLGIAEAHTPVRDGASKGKVERNFRTLRSRFLSTLDASKIHSLERFNALLDAYIETHNRTFHTGINERPVDRYLRTKNYIRIPRSREWLDECFYNFMTRKVREDCVITIDGAEYDVPARFAGCWVEVRFNPERPDDSYLLHNGGRFPIRRTDRVANGTASRNADPLAIC